MQTHCQFYRHKGDVTSVFLSLSVCLSLSLSLCLSHTHRPHLTHNFGNASALPIFHYHYNTPQRYSRRNLVFMSASMVPAADNRVTLDHFSPRLWLVVSLSPTEHLFWWTCFQGRCNPPVPCSFLRKKFYHSSTLLYQARTFCRFVLETLSSNYFSSFLSFLFFPFA